MPSTRDAAMNGGAIGLLFDPGVSGDYIQFLSHPSTSFSDQYRGNPTANGYISINICSNRAGVSFDTANPHYYNNLTASNDARFLGVCVVNSEYMDDAGGPGDRIRLTVTYNHPLIIPYFQALWPHLKISHTQDAIVEKFRTARLSGLAGSMSTMAPYTPTPLPPTDTPTSPPTSTPTSTPVPCEVPPDGNGLLARYYAFVGDANTDPFTNLVYFETDQVVDFNWGTSSPIPGFMPADNFRVVWSGLIYPPYPGNYTFTTVSDDGVRLFIDNNPIISNWTNHSKSTDTFTWPLNCGSHIIRLEYYENIQNAFIQLGWQNGNIGAMMPIPRPYLFPDTTTLEADQHLCHPDSHPYQYPDADANPHEHFAAHGYPGALGYPTAQRYPRAYRHPAAYRYFGAQRYTDTLEYPDTLDYSGTAAHLPVQP